MTIDRTTRSSYYRIFVLTFWLEEADDGDDPTTWRFRLEDPRSGKRRGCVGVQRLVALLTDEIADGVVLVDGQNASTK